MMTKGHWACALVLALGSCSSQSRGEACKFDTDKWRSVRNNPPELSIINRIHVKNDGTFWNGQKINDKQLSLYLSIASKEETPPFIILNRDDNLSCDEVNRVRVIIETHYECSNGLCGQ